ncbi:hypothetical protein ACQKWADRAFT_320794 [Trichoderma austrokoningii]
MMLASTNKQSKLLALQALIATALATVPGWRFHPQRCGFTSGGLANYPTPYNLSTSQTNIDPASTNGSFWSSSFIHGENGRDYLVIANAAPGLDAGGGVFVDLYRASILDLEDTSQYSQYAVLTTEAQTYGPTGIINFTVPGFTFQSTSATNPLSSIHTASDISDVDFDLTYELSSPPILNAGDGTFQIEGGTGFQWSMPAGKTTGWLSINNTKVNVDTSRSLTWYDRQWGIIPSSFSWFQVHIPGLASDGTEDKFYSIWAWNDIINGNKQFATHRTGERAQQIVLPVTEVVSSNRIFTSPVTGNTYPLDWTITIPGGPVLSLSSIRPDQEIASAGVPVVSYTGFLNVTARYPGGLTVPGFAVIESL